MQSGNSYGIFKEIFVRKIISCRIDSLTLFLSLCLTLSQSVSVILLLFIFILCKMFSMCAFVFFSYRSFIFLLFRPTFNILYENSKKKTRKKKINKKRVTTEEKKIIITTMYTTPVTMRFDYYHSEFSFVFCRHSFK